MKYLHLDHYLYIISDEDMDRVDHAVGDCCGFCCPETLQSLRLVFLDIKKRYMPYELSGQHSTPEDQSIKTDDSEGLPF